MVNPHPSLLTPHYSFTSLTLINMDYFYTFTLWLHLMAVIAWIGGMIFHILVLDPVFSTTEVTVEGMVLLGKMEKRFRYLVGTSIILLLLTGLVNARFFISAPERFLTAYGMLLLVKIGLILGMIFIFIICPKTQSCSVIPGACDIDAIDKRLSQLPPEVRAHKIKIEERKKVILPKVALALGAVIILLSVIMKRV